MKPETKSPTSIVRDLLGLDPETSWVDTQRCLMALKGANKRLEAEIQKAVVKLQAITGDNETSLDLQVENVRELLKAPGATVATEVKRRVRLALIAERIKRDGIEALSDLGDDKQQALLISQLLTEAAYRVNS